MFSRNLCGEGIPTFYMPTNVDHECPDTFVAKAVQLSGRCRPLANYTLDYDDAGLPTTDSCGK